ncbi:MAG TPA: M81 family metallopeptidase [Microvirga sp.]|jgi:microcystin degradation protein MlrC|nr:M81 family metallopeptidase [Microvirga sp.]
MNRRRILLAGLFHETHTFVPEPTRAADFTIRRGADMLARRGDGSTVDGFLEVAESCGWEVVPVADYGALPAGPVEHGVFEAFWGELDAGLRRALNDGGLDGIWLALHGAMVTTDCEDPEGELLARIRAVPGAAALPLFGVFDLHATFTAAMARHADGLVAYRENPHTDAREAAVRSARLLARALDEGLRPRMHARTAPVIWPPTGTGTADRPMRDLAALARRIEAEDADVWAVNVIGGYAFSDVPEVGVSFSLVTTGPAERAEAALASLVDTAASLRELGVPREWDLDAALDQIGTPERGPVLLVEPADNIGGGAPGDGTAILRAFLRRGVHNAAVAIADPGAVESLRDAQPGETRRLAIGGRGSALDEGPVAVEAVFVSRSDGHFTLEDRNSHLAAAQGVHFSMGPCAVVRVEGVTVLLTSRKTPPFDLAQWRSQGIDPESLSLIGVKAAVAHRRAYDKIAAASYTVTTPGPCTSDLTQLPYRRVRRPVFPLDPPWRP